MKIIINNKLWLEEIPSGFADELKDRMTFRNPAFVEAEKMGRWTGETPEYLSCYEKSANGLILPRGFCRQLIGLCRARGIPFTIDDCRRTLPAVDFTFKGELKPFQIEAVSEIRKRDFGTLSLPTGGGKTVVGLYTIAARRLPALIVVHTKELLNQWIDRIETFLDIPRNEIGVIGGGKLKIGEKITVSLVQSLYKCADEVSPYIGFLVVDECHRTPSRTFTEAVSAFDCRYMLGLSATPYRREGLGRLIYWHLGDVVHEVDKSQLVENGDILQAEVITRETDFESFYDPSEEYSKMLSELTQDTERNRLIASDINTETRNGGGICLVLSDRKSHCQGLQTILMDYYNVRAEVLTGDLPKTQREAIFTRLNAGKVKVLISTTFRGV